MDYRVYLIKEAKKGITYATFKKNKVKMPEDERQEAIAAGASWAHQDKANKGKSTSAISKAIVDGKNWYSSSTHRAVSIKPTLKGAIKAFEFIESTS